MLTVKDFLNTIKVDLQEKNEDKKFWDDPQLLIKIQRAYKVIQEDLPFFKVTQKVVLKEGQREYNLKKEAIENIYFKVKDSLHIYCEDDNLYKHEYEKYYTLMRDILVLSYEPVEEVEAEVSYKYAKSIENENDAIELPTKYEEPLRLLVTSYIHEKPTRNSKERDLAVHYLKRYNLKIEQLKRNKKIRATGVRSKYIKV